MSDGNKLVKIYQEKLQQTEQKIHRAEGALEQAMTNLKQLGFKSIKDAIKTKEKLENEIETLEEESISLLEKVGDLLEETE